MSRGREYLIRSPGVSRVAESGDAERKEVESVSGLTRRIKAVLESTIVPCWVRGEVSNLRAQASGHLYFSLKDAESQISCVLFRGDAARGDFAALVRDGAQVLVFAGISVYEPRGNYQLIVRAVVDDGRGRLQEKFEKLKQQLAAEGLFDAVRKKPLPVMPRTIGFITSPTGAAVQDFIRILKRRQWVGRLIVLPVRVQGEGAAAEIFAALELAHQTSDTDAGPTFDLLVIGRGGGSLEDLWAFNEEPLVRAVAGSRIPIISAVGHEIDFTLCDFAADVRAETPSAAAELISSDFLQCIERVRQAMAGLDEGVDQCVHSRSEDLENARTRLMAGSPAALVERSHLRLDDLQNRLLAAVRHDHQVRKHVVTELLRRLERASPEARVGQMRERVSALDRRLAREAELIVGVKQRAHVRLGERLAALDPANVLRRGYVIVRDADGRPVVERKSLQSGHRVKAQFHDGEAPMIVE